MSWGLAQTGMLAGLAGVAIPLVIHLLNQRRTTVVDWGAMQFLELGRRARRKFQLSEMLLTAGRMTLLGLVALAMTRPFWMPAEAASPAGGGAFDAGLGGVRRDVVLVIDGSGSMSRRAADGASVRDAALRWAKRFTESLGPGDSVAILGARDRVTPLLAPASYDLVKARAALDSVPAARGASDLAAAVAEALRLLDVGANPVRDVVVLGDGQAFAWRSDEPSRWEVVRALQREQARRAGIPTRIWALNFDADPADAGLPNCAVAPLRLARGLITPEQPIAITTSVANAGPRPLARAAELRLDGRPVPGTSRVVGPIPPGAAAPLAFKTSVAALGSHVVSVRLTGRPDALADDDEAARAIEVTAALPVLLVDGEPGAEPLSSETDFVRAALAPTGAETPSIRARVVKSDSFKADDLAGRRVVVLANVRRVDANQAAALDAFLDQGGGILTAPGDQTDVEAANALCDRDGAGFMPARLGDLKGDFARRQTNAHPSPSSFVGAWASVFAQGDDPPLAAADLFAYRVLKPAADAAATARLDNGDPWLVERPSRSGRAAILAGPIDAEGGTLPVNPDFVPWIHELLFHLADAASAARSVQPGEPVVIDLDPAPAAEVARLTVTMPDGTTSAARVERAGGKARALFDGAGEPGVYRIQLPGPAGGFAYATVDADPRESNLAPIDAEARAAIARDWPFAFEPNPGRLAGRLLAGGPGGRREIWRYLVLAALCGLCLEVWLTRRLVQARGSDDLAPDPGRADG